MSIPFFMNNFKLYVVATPLGHKDDITLRGIEILKSVRKFFAEDGRETKKLMNMHGISIQHASFLTIDNYQIERTKKKARKWIEEKEPMALVTDRGTPGISDPGSEILKLMHEHHVPVVPIPGPSSVSALLSMTGMAITQFFFVGFLPRSKKNQRLYIFKQIQHLLVPTIFFESKERILQTLSELREHFPQARIFIGREMTKLYEEYIWVDMESYATHPSLLNPRGEFTCILFPTELPTSMKDVDASTTEEKKKLLTKNSYEEYINVMIKLKCQRDKEWSKEVIHYGKKLFSHYDYSPKDLYKKLQESKKKF